MLRKLKRLALSRVFPVSVLIAAQLLLILVTAVSFARYYVFYSAASFVLALCLVLRICHADRNMAYKLAWTVVILLFPAFGAAVYGILGGNRLSKRSAEKMRFGNETSVEALRDCGLSDAELRKEYPNAARQAAYIRSASGCPACRNCGTRYYASGEEMLPDYCAALERAEKYIFLEYFIIGEGEIWDRIHGILRRKAAAGVDVRVIYDDIGCIMTLDRRFAARLEAEGIGCRVFHRFVPVLSARQNNRDHRKLTVIDGLTAFAGGVNLADEYFNVRRRFGYWKDSAVRITGEAAWSFAVMFLSMWDSLGGGQRSDWKRFRPETGPAEASERFPGGGLVQPYADSPLDSEPTGENVYLGLLAEAQDYVWIMTPYLILDEQMVRALCRAVRSGVDVRILTPGIPDKKIVNQTTKAFYPVLLAGGVKICEYEPGFLHAKTFLCDDRYAVVGSVNLDYRSLYLHFECGVWMADADCIADIRADFLAAMKLSRPVKIPEGRIPPVKQFFRGLLELLAPLM